MRFMMLMYPNLADGSEDGVLPSAELMTAMMTFNNAMQKAGILLALDGLKPTSKGARVTFGGGKRTVVDGPFTESKELVGGYWLIQVKSKAEAVEWATRCPAQSGDRIEIRQVFEMTDFPAELQEAAQKA